VGAPLPQVRAENILFLPSGLLPDMLKYNGQPLDTAEKKAPFCPWDRRCLSSYPAFY